MSAILFNGLIHSSLSSIFECAQKAGLPKWLSVYELCGCEFESPYCHLNFRYVPVSSKEFLDIQATLECWFILKRVRDMIIAYNTIGLVSIWNEGSIFIPIHTGIISYFWIWLFVTFCFIKFNAKVSLKSSGEGWLFSAEVRSKMHKKWKFPLRISSVNMTKSAVSCGFSHIYWRNP